MTIHSYQGYTQPYSGLAEDLMNAGREFLSQQAAPVLQQLAPPAPAPVQPVAQPAPVQRMLTQAAAPASAAPAGMTPAAMLGLAALAYWLFFKK